MDTIQIDKNTIDFSIKKKIKLFLYASSSAVYDLNEGLKRKNEALLFQFIFLNKMSPGIFAKS